MLIEMITRDFATCPVCGRYHAYYPLEYYWCPYCGSNLKQQINELDKRVSQLENSLNKLLSDNGAEQP